MSEMEPTARSPRRSDDIEVKLPMGVTVRASGKQVTLIILVILGVMAILGLVREHDLKNAEAHGVLAERLDTIGYILTLNEEERKRLKMSMPVGLRKQLLEEERSSRR